MQIKNWNFFLLTLFFIALFILLGCWQLSRAHQKKILLNMYTEREKTLLDASALTSIHDLRFYRIKLTGTFDNQHTFLLDNRVFHGKLGFEIYTPFKVKNTPFTLLVDRGFLAMGSSRRSVPFIKEIQGETTINGLIKAPSRYFALGPMLESTPEVWPQRIEFIDLFQLAKLLNHTLFSYLIMLTPDDKAAYPIEWQLVTFGPERHFAYAIQWFALALTLLILSFFLNRHPH